MSNKVYDILKGKFLISNDSLKNWRFITFIVLLMMLMIASAHSIDKKVMKISKLSKEVKELRAQFVDMRSISVKMKLESTVREKVFERGIKPSENPPFVIKVIKTKEE